MGLSLFVAEHRAGDRVGCSQVNCVVIGTTVTCRSQAVCPNARRFSSGGGSAAGLRLTAARESSSEGCPQPCPLPGPDPADPRTCGGRRSAQRRRIPSPSRWVKASGRTRRHAGRAQRARSSGALILCIWASSHPLGGRRLPCVTRKG